MLVLKLKYPFQVFFQKNASVTVSGLFYPFWLYVHTSEYCFSVQASIIYPSKKPNTVKRVFPNSTNTITEKVSIQIILNLEKFTKLV